MHDRISAAELIEADEDNPGINEALYNVVGDAYLVVNNPIYKGIRLRALMIGVTYSCRPSPLWRSYQALSLVCLPKILRDQVVPYTPTRDVVDDLKRQNIKFRADWFVGNLRHNALLHESAHCVAQQVLTDTQQLPPGNRDVWCAILGHNCRSFRTCYTLNRVIERCIKDLRFAAIPNAEFSIAAYANKPSIRQDICSVTDFAVRGGQAVENFES